MKPSNKSAKWNKTVSNLELGALRERITDLVLKNPKKAAKILTDWLHGTHNRTTGKNPKKAA